MKKIKKNSLVLIEWEDSSLGFQGWKVIRDQPKKCHVLLSTGFVVAITKRAVILYPHVDKKKSPDRSWSGDIIIPCSAIKKITKLKF